MASPPSPQSTHPLLRALMVDLASTSVSSSNDDGEPQLTLATCLRQTKDVPSLLVEDLLQQQQSAQNDHHSQTPNIALSPTTIRLAQSAILTGPISTMLQWAKQKQPPSSSNDTSNDDTNSPRQLTTAMVLQEMLTVIQFLHLALEVQYRHKQNNNNNTTRTVSPASSSSNDNDNMENTTSTEMDCSDVAPNIIRSLSGVVQHFLQNYPIPHGDTQQSFSHMIRTASIHGPLHPHHVAIFAWQSLLRLGNHYMERHPRLLHVLWKVLGELATAFSTNFPSELSLQALKALIYLLRQGTPPTLQALAQYGNKSAKLPHNFKPLKIVAFLLSRATFYIQAYHKDPTTTKIQQSKDHQSATSTSTSTHSKVFPKLLEQAALWSGLPHILSNTIPTDHPAWPTTKAAKCWAALAKSTMITQNVLLLAPSLAESLEWMSANDHGNDDSDTTDRVPPEVALARQSIAVGKSLFVLGIVEGLLAKKTHMDVENVLQWVRVTLHQALPIFSVVRSQRSKAKPLQDSMVRAVALVVQSLGIVCNVIQGDSTKLQSVYFAFIAWLADAASPNQHPMILEVWTMALSHFATIHDTFAALAVRLLFDPRTCDHLRSSLSHVLRRAMLSCRQQKDHSAVQVMESMVVDQVQTVWKDLRRSSRKRKRSQESSPQLDVRALASIGQVLLLVPSKDFASAVEFGDVSKTLSSKTSARDFLLLALACYCHQRIDTSLIQQAFSLVHGREDEAASTSTSKTAAAEALLVAYFSQQACAEDSNDALNLPFWKELIEQVLPSRSVGSQVRFAAIRALHTVGRRLPKSLPSDDPGQYLVPMYKTALAVEGKASWPLRFHALSAFSRFSYDAPEYCQSFLAKCLTPSTKIHFTHRLKGIVYTQALANGNADTKKLLEKERKLHNQAMAGCISTAKDARIFNGPGEQLLIPIGSYVLRMKALGSRTTTVIFPPEKESLEDIHAMLADDEEPPTIYRVTSSTTTQKHGNIAVMMQRK